MGPKWIQYLFTGIVIALAAVVLYSLLADKNIINIVEDVIPGSSSSSEEPPCLTGCMQREENEIVCNSYFTCDPSRCSALEKKPECCCYDIQCASCKSAP